MIESQTFAILRDPESLAGAQRITSPKLKRIFEKASSESGLPASYISAIAYLESWGLSNAESYAGPKGIMQIAAGTARSMGLRIVYATRYRTVTVTRKVKSRKGKVTTKRSKRKVPYSVLVRDERLIPEKAVPAAANYLARLEQKYGGRDWAIFAYHCGEGCTGSVPFRRARYTTGNSTMRSSVTWIAIFRRHITFVFNARSNC
jgi:soluble lytic murein transglycosylase-like protein